MKHKQTKTGYMYPSINLALYVKLLLAAHFFLLITLLMDLLPLIQFKGRSELARKLPNILICMLKYT